MSRSLTEVKEVFKKYQVLEPRKEVYIIPRCNLPQALWDLDINPMFTDLEALFQESDQSPPRLDRSTMQSGTFEKSTSASFKNKRSATSFVELNEFKTLYLMLFNEYATCPQRVLATFMQLDENSSGFITQEQLVTTLNHGRADKLTEEEFTGFWEAVDLDLDGEVQAAEFVVAMCPSISADELNAMLSAYGLEPNAHLYVQYLKKPKQKSVAAINEQKRRDKEEAEETERLAQEEEDARRREEAEQEQAEAARKKKEEEDEARRKKQQEEADRNRREEQQRKKDAEARELKEADDRKTKEPKKEEPKKEGGCCVVQ